ncbi:hypothetical protein GCM10009544_19160 [Streptomyces stramineus]|uniref:Mycothiol-dependent maleylpyruvate isomerase metal-binding domain-containing protein n=1 Tax=Streptomyces stramineus TaxID=173861 RepID=A0ABP3JKI1_9ACTN
MITAHRPPRAPVTADDVEHAVHLAVTALGTAPDDRWAAPAGTLEWDCWETVEHLTDDLFAYAAQLGPRIPPLDRYVPWRFAPLRPGGPRNAVFADREAGPAGLLRTLEAGGGLLAAVARTRGPEVRAFHSWGVTDPEGLAAMGTAETLVHLHDLAGGLGFAWEPPAGLCDRVRARLFPDAPAGTDPWRTLLWATGRAGLPGLARRDSWRWHSAPLPTARD